MHLHFLLFWMLFLLMINIAKSETFKNFTVLNKDLLFLFKINLIARTQTIGLMDRGSATEKAYLSSIPGRVKPKNIKVGIHNFPA